MTDNNNTALGRLGVIRLDVMQKSPVTEADHWLFPGFVSTTNSYIYGQSKVGKSFAVSQIIASLIDGREFLGRIPLSTDHTVLIVCTDSGSQAEYQERLTGLGVDATKVHLVQLNGEIHPGFWEDLRAVVSYLGVSVVVFDHATGGMVGDFNAVGPWNDLWNNLKSLGDGVARILVGHATDSKFEGSVIHKPSGSFAATANARSRTYVWAPGPNGIDDPQREIRLVGNNLKGGSQTIACYQGEDGYLELAPEDEQPVSPRERTRERRSTTGEIIRLALEAPPMPQADVHQMISDSPSVRNSHGDRMGTGTIRNRLSGISTIRWDKAAKRYVKA